ncbi:MAG TPA: alpha/beta hydrolase-fold protein [Segetibacter sp.]|nr:alpha/beta hydrolase-fold protein [Segetibacter sp.]
MDEEIVVLGIEETSVFITQEKTLYSDYLERKVIIDIYIPKTRDTKGEFPLLLINDGQDLRKMNFEEILNSMFSTEDLEPFVAVGIHCSNDRINEYGTICRADYNGRGTKAGLYNRFVLDELLPFLKIQLKTNSFKEKAFAGFSLGGLSALDIVWNNATEFTKTGVFSGSLWWRRRGYEDEGYNWDKDRIMHLQVQRGKHCAWLKFFFECGRLDETADRNNNGIIDSIEDTLDLIEDMKAIGYADEQIHYTELEDGRHNVETWARAFPEFLKWGWGRR